MPDVTYPYIPSNGNTFDPEQFNENLYATPDQLPANKLSIYETSNGRITVGENFAAGFKVEAHHVRPWQVGDAAAAGLTSSVDYYEDAWGTDEKYYGIAGAQLTFYQKYDCTMALMAASLFASIWRQRGVRNTEPAPDTFDDIPIRIKMYVDGVPVNHTLRRMPETIFYPIEIVNYGYDFTREQNLTRYLNLVHPKHTGGDASKGHGPLTRGWHTFGFGIYIQANTAKENVFLKGSNTGLISETSEVPMYQFDALHRVRVYARNASVLRLL